MKPDIRFPFSNVHWNEYDGWTITSIGCGCCSTTEINVTSRDLLSLREKIMESLNSLDQIIMIVNEEERDEEELHERIKKLNENK